MIPQLEQKAEAASAAEAAEKKLLRNRVTEEEIADIVSRSTGIPVSKMLQGDKERLLKMEAALHERVVGQTRRFPPLQMRFGAPGRVFQIPIDQTVRFFFLVPLVWVKLSCASRWLPFFLIQRAQ